VAPRARWRDRTVTDERRHQARFAHPLEGSWRGASGATRARIADISTSGCFVQSLAEPSPGETTVVTIEFGAEDAMALPSEVVYAERGMGFAVKFVGLDDATVGVLQAKIDALRQAGRT
jgi:hypothetical protein